MNSNEVKCTQYGTVDDAAVRVGLWAVYATAFANAETECIQQQLCYTQESFDEALRDPAYRKFVVTDGTDVVGFILCTNDLEKARVAYVNPVRLQTQFPEYAGRIWYFTAFAIRPDLQGRRYAPPLMAAATAFMDAERALVAFDFSTEKNAKLPDLLTWGMQSAQTKLGLRTKKSTYMPLGGQMYGVIKMTEE